MAAQNLHRATWSAPLKTMKTTTPPTCATNRGCSAARARKATSVPQHSAVLAVQLGSQEQLRRLPRARLEELLERYRDCLDQAASLYQGEVTP
jgi:hypothetical protein